MGDAMEKRPVLLTHKELIEPIIISKDFISKIEKEIENNKNSELILQGLFVLLYSSFETMFTDILKRYLTHFPEKIDKSEMKFEKDEILHTIVTSDIIDIQINRYIIGIAYKNLNELIQEFMSILSIDKENLDNELVSKILEIKATRNILIHNSLKVNSNYIEQAKKFARNDKIGSKIKIDQQYLFFSLNTIKAIVNDIEKRISNKYKDYTKVRAIKELWNYMFPAHVDAFSDFWNIKENEDSIGSMKICEYEDCLCSSEKLFLGMWRAHFNGNVELLKDFNIKRLDKGNQHKMLYFLSVQKDFWLY